MPHDSLIPTPAPRSTLRPASTPEPPYYAVIFTSIRPATDPAVDPTMSPGLDDGYAATADLLEELAASQPGYLGMDSARGPDGLGITVSYWEDEGSIAAWRDQLDHARARREGRHHWYDAFSLHVARVERAHRFER